MLDDALKSQLKAYLEKVVRPIEIRANVDDSAKSKEMVGLLEDIAGLSDKIVLTQGRDAAVFDRSIDIQISRLRQKLNEDARAPRIIKTVRNGGYALSVPVSMAKAS